MNVSGHSNNYVQTLPNTLPIFPFSLNVKVFSLMNLDGISNALSLFYDGQVYEREGILAGDYLDATIRGSSHQIPIKHIKSIVILLDKNVTDSEGLEITS